MLNVSEVSPTAQSEEALNELKHNDSIWVCIANVTSQSFDIEGLLLNRIYGFTVSVGYYKGYHGQFAGKEFVNISIDSSGTLIYDLGQDELFGVLTIHEGVTRKI